MTNLNDSAGYLGVAAYATDSYTPPGLILAGSFPLESSVGTLLDPNADVAAFTLLGRITASGKLTASDPAAVDGSQVPVGILTRAVPDPGGDVAVTFWRSGNFNYDYIVKNVAWTLAALRIAIETAGTPLFFGQPKTASPTDAA